MALYQSYKTEKRNKFPVYNIICITNVKSNINPPTKIAANKTFNANSHNSGTPERDLGAIRNEIIALDCH